VDHDPKTDRYGLRYSELISPIIKAVQELYAKLLGLEAEQDRQARDIASMRSENQELKTENQLKEEKIKELEKRLERLEKALQSK
jgi:predicted nuclease with TOPRIM domain